MNLKVLLILICCLYLNQGMAQKQTVYFLKNSGSLVQSRDSADYIRIVSEPESETDLYDVKEYYKNGVLKLTGKSSMIYPRSLTGQCMSYFPSGKKKQYANYKLGHLDGDVYDYYPNGRVYLYKKYIYDKNNYFDTNYLILACNDSTGRELTVDGNGSYIGYDAAFKEIQEKGDVKAGLKDGKWTGNNGDQKNYITFSEEYAGGKLVSGQSTDRDNKTVNYTEQDHEPQYKGGIGAFYQYLISNIWPTRIPIETKNMVVVSFIVEKDGIITDAKIARTSNDDLSKQALKVLKLSSKWVPGLQHGRAVSAQYSVPVITTTYIR